MGIEPIHSTWKVDVLPLNYICVKNGRHSYRRYAQRPKNNVVHHLVSKSTIV